MAILLSAELQPGVQTDLTGGGLSAGAAGTYMLNLCNDTDGAIAVSAIFVTNGEAPAAKHKWQPAQTIEAKGWRAIMPMALGAGFKVFVTADGPGISAQLNAKED